MGTNDWFGRSVAVSGNGKTVASGDNWNDDNGNGSGHVCMFEYNADSKLWEQEGGTLVGLAELDFFGECVAFSGDRTIVAIGGTGNDSNNNRAGHVRAFRYNDDSMDWQQIGQTLKGKAAKDFFWEICGALRRRFRISGRRYAKTMGTVTHRAMFVSFDTTRGERDYRLGQDVDGESPHDNFGNAIALSADGTSLVVGASRNDGGGLAAGHVRVFVLEGYRQR